MFRHFPVNMMGLMVWVNNTTSSQSSITTVWEITHTVSPFSFRRSVSVSTGPRHIRPFPSPLTPHTAALFRNCRQKIGDLFASPSSCRSTIRKFDPA